MTMHLGDNVARGQPLEPEAVLKTLGRHRRRTGEMATRNRGMVLGSVMGESGNTFSVRLMPSGRIVVITGAGCEWRLPPEDFLKPGHSTMFYRVADLLQDRGVL